MARFEKKPLHKFSRVKSDLAELQRWWPVHIKDDGVLGISIDPVLYRTKFSTNEVSDIVDEAVSAGIRVEAIQDDGTDVSGTEPTIVISGSGTFNPRCTINHADGTSTVIMLIARTRYQDFTGSDGCNASQIHPDQILANQDSEFNNTESGQIQAWGEDSPKAGPAPRVGPYPVFMTVQELCELIDTYRHIGDVDSEKKAWQPHKAGGAPAINADTRVSSDPLPASSPYRATVFMPMMLDNNQFSKNISGSATVWSHFDDTESPKQVQFTKNGITRYDSDPEGADASLIKYKRVGESGDHQENATWIANQTQPRSVAEATATPPIVAADMMAGYSSFDSTEAPPPKYRMAMALACFLKDGTYSLNNGVIIPYSYDAGRTFGGKTSDTMYMRWNNEAGYGDATALTHRTAGVYPFFDFVQGPITPRAQGSNWTHAVLADHQRSQPALRLEVPPNGQRVRIREVGVVDDSLAGGRDVLRFKIDRPLSASSTGADGPYVGHNLSMHNFTVGQAVYVEDLDGILGTGAVMTQESGQIWDSRYDTRRGPSRTDRTPSTNTGEKDCNGWWIVSNVHSYDISSSPHPTIMLDFIINSFSLPKTTSYTPTKGTLCAGRMGGPETKFTGAFVFKTTGVDTDPNHDYPLELNTQTKFDGTKETWGATSSTGIQLNDETNQNTAVPKFRATSTNTDRPSVATIGTGFQAGMGQGDLNVPIASSRNDTGPARQTLGERAVKTEGGEFIGSRPVPRSISIQTMGVTPNEVIASSPTQVSTENGSLRIPAPLGHDLCVRYTQISEERNMTSLASPLAPINLVGTKWNVRSDLGMAADNLEDYNTNPDNINSKIGQGGEDKWAWRGVSSALWSYIDGNTGRHAWDYIKPSGSTVTWTYGRNRCWPAHERMGTRLAMTPSLNPKYQTAFPETFGQEFASQVTMFSGGLTSTNLSAVGQEETRIGLSEYGCSPIFLDMQMTAFIPLKSNRLSIIEFDMNDSDELLGRHHMIYSLPNRDMGFGFRPNWGGITDGGVFTKGSNKWKTNDGTEVEITANSVLDGTAVWQDDVLDTNNHDPPVVEGYNANFFGFSVDSRKSTWNAQKQTSNYNVRTSAKAPFPNSGYANRPAIWFTAGSTHFSQEVFGTGQKGVGSTLSFPSQGGFGRMGTGYGYGPSFSYSEGFNTVRGVFTSSGMTCIFNGETIGTDNSAQEPVWGFQIKACNVFSMTDRRPTAIAGHEDRLSPIYSHLQTEEPCVANKGERRDFDASKPLATPVDRARFGFVGNVGSGQDPFTNASQSTIFPLQLQACVTDNLDASGFMTRADNPAVQTSNTDLQVDEIILRQIPTPAMLPFTVDTLKQQAPAVASGLARYTSILIEADNINASKGMKVTVTLLEPPSGTGIAKEASTVITGFEELDPDFIGGVGEVDLRGLPTSAVVNGFVIRFNFYIPSSEQGDLHPIDWSATPIIRKYNVFFDHKPTAQNTVIGNTFDGSTATTVGQTTVQTFTTKVGHIVSFRLQGNTTDPDRKIKALKVDLGDGTITDFMPVTTPAQSVSLDISHVYSARPAGGTYDIKVFAQDDSENESDYILIPNAFLRVTIVAAEPVAVVRAVPSMVRAGQAIRFDGSDSYSIDTSANLTNFAWTFGDGSTGVNGGTSHQDHTYAAAGEYMATLIVTDSTGTQSPYAKAVVKVLPATLVVPLTLSTKPSSFSRTRTATISQTPILDAIYPEMTDMGNRGDEFTLTGMFLKETQETDIAFMEELLLSGALVEFEYQEVNFTGVADSKTFVGRMVSFDYNRQGGSLDTTPYTASFVREAGLGA